MIRITHNGRPLGITFNYSRRYPVQVPRKALSQQEIISGAFKPVEGSDNLVEVERPLTQCYIVEGAGKDQRILGKHEAGLYFKDQRFRRDDPRREEFFKAMIRAALRSAGDGVLSKDERKVIWHAFLTRFSKRRSVVPPPTEIPPTPAVQATVRGMRATVATPAAQPLVASPAPPYRKPRVRLKLGEGGAVIGHDIIDPGYPAIDTHQVVSKVVRMPRQMNYPRELPRTADGFLIH